MTVLAFRRYNFPSMMLQPRQVEITFICSLCNQHFIHYADVLIRVTLVLVCDWSQGYTSGQAFMKSHHRAYVHAGMQINVSLFQVICLSNAVLVHMA